MESFFIYEKKFIKDSVIYPEIPDNFIKHIWSEKKLIAVLHHENPQKVKIDSNLFSSRGKIIETVSFNYNRELIINFGTPRKIDIPRLNLQISCHGELYLKIEKNLMFLNYVNYSNIADDIYLIKILQPFIINALKKTLNRSDIDEKSKNFIDVIKRKSLYHLKKSLISIGLEPIKINIKNFKME